MACRDKSIVENISKVFCVILLVLQSCILDYYLVENDSKAWIGFVVVDVVVVVLWIAALYLAYQQHRRKTHARSSQTTGSKAPDELRIAYVAWLVYAIGYTIQVAFIFKTFAHKLNNPKTSSVFGQNVLKLSLMLTPMLFLLLVHAHHDADPSSPRKYYIERLTGGVTVDLMDSIEILEILFVERSKVNLSISMGNSIIAFSCVNVFLPTLALYALRRRKLWHSSVLATKVLYNFCYVFLVNVPFLVIRLLLWAHYDQDVSVFLVKNVILIVLNSWEILESILCQGKKARDDTDATETTPAVTSNLEGAGMLTGSDGGTDDQFDIGYV